MLVPCMDLKNIKKKNRWYTFLQMNPVNHEKAITMARVCNNYFQNYFSL